MKIKTKLRIGFGFLFMVILLFGAMSLFYIKEIARNANVILKDNYETLSYTREMRALLDEHELPLLPKVADTFARQLQKEERNITERGEREAVQRLHQAFDELVSLNRSDLAELRQAERQVRQQLRYIETLNMQAIMRKNMAARRSVDRAEWILGIAGALAFVVLLSFSIGFPAFIAEPLRALAAGIREISQKNYSERIHFDHQDEFADVATAFNKMADRLNEWENSNLATVTSEKRRIEAIIDQMHDAIFGVNEVNEVVFMNDAARHILQIGEEHIVGQHIGQLLQHNELLREAIAQGAVTDPFKMRVDGREAYFQLYSRNITVPDLNKSRTPDAATRPAGKVYMLRNVTEFKERDEAKTHFIATISHELKTPISSIKMSTQLLTDDRVGGMNEEQRQLVAHIQDDTTRLLKITSELLELSQVETGHIQLELAAVSPAQIISYAVEAIKLPAEQKGVTIDLDIAHDLPKVKADMERTAWVLVNFLSNALRYSSARSKVEVSARVLGPQVEFSVRDHGKGIDEQYQKRLFDRYFQVPTDGQNRSGSGLGLAISKDFIEAQQGRIWVKSALGEGSRFSFTLPVA